MILKDITTIRSKNAGPFWISIDIFYHTNDYKKISKLLTKQNIATLLHVNADDIHIYDLQDLSVFKISLPRKYVQGSRFDRDMHGAQIACLFQEIKL